MLFGQEVKINEDHAFISFAAKQSKPLSDTQRSFDFVTQ